MTLVDDILHRVDDYLARTGMKPTNFGLSVCKTGALLQRMRAGRTSAKSMQAVVDYLDAYETSKKRRA